MNHNKIYPKMVKTIAVLIKETKKIIEILIAIIPFWAEGGTYIVL